MPAKQTDSGATSGYEAELWAMASALRTSMDVADDKHIVLRLGFLTYFSDAFEERHAVVLTERGQEATEDWDESIAENTFWVPPELRWARLKVEARQPAVRLDRDVGVEPQEDDGEPLEEQMTRLVAELREQQSKGALPDVAIIENLIARGVGGRGP